MGSLVTSLRLIITGSSASACAAVGRLRGATAGLGASMLGASKRMAVMGAAMTKYVTAPLLIIGGLAVHSAAKFEASMKLIQTQCGGTAKDVRILTGAVEELAVKGQHGPDELAAALYHLKSVGMDNVQAIEALTQTEKLASVGQADLEATTNAVAGAWRTGINGAGDFGKAVGTVNAIIGAGNLRMEEFNSAMGTGILITAKTFGLGLKDVGAALALFTSQGMPATASATRLRMAISLMAAPTAKAAGVLKDIGLGTTDLAKAMRDKGLVGAVKLLKDHLEGMSKLKQSQVLSAAFGGARTGTAVMALVDGYDTLLDKQKQVAAGQENFGAAVKAQSETSAAAFARLKSTMHELLDVFGKILLPYVERGVKWLQSLGETINGLSPGWKDFIVKAALAAAVIGPLLLIVSKIILVVLAVKTALGALSLVSMGWIGLAIAIGIGLVLLYKKCGWFRDAVNWVGRALLWLYSNVAKPVFEAIVAIVEWAWPYIVIIVKQKVAEVKAVIGAIRVVIDVLRNIWDRVRDVARVVWDAIKSVVADRVRAVKQTIEAIKSIIEFVRNVWIGVREGAREIWDQVKEKVKAAVNAIKDFVGGKVEAVRDKVLEVWRALRDGTKPIWEAVVGIVETAWNNIAEFVNKIIKAINWVLDKVPGIGESPIPLLPVAVKGGAPVGRTGGGGGGGGGDDYATRPSGRGGSSGGNFISDAAGWLKDAWDKLATPWPHAPGGLFSGVGSWLLETIKKGIFGLFKEHAGPRQQIVDLAKGMLGTPYVWGGESPGGFDCSGLIHWAYGAAGLDWFPRIPGRSPMGTRIGRSQIQPADVMFYNPNALQNGARVPFGHFKMYIGDNQTIESTSGGVQIRPADWAGAAQIRSYLANGGFTNGPSIAGEKGIELVLPMTKPRRTAELLQAAGLVGGGTITIVNVTVPMPAGTTIIGTAAQVAETLRPHIVRGVQRSLERRARRR